MLINITQEKNLLKISKINKDGELEFIELYIPTSQKFEWEYFLPNTNDVKPDKVMLSWDDKPVYKKRIARLSDYRKIEFIEGLKDEIKKDIYELNIPNILYVDIETEIIDGFPSPQRADCPITCIGYYDTTGLAVVTGTTKLTNTQIKNIRDRIQEHFSDSKFDMLKFRFDYKYFEYESDMLEDFFNNWVCKYNAITGWNFINFDWVYLINRANKLEVDYKCFLEDGAYMGTEVRGYPVTHKLVFDYMSVFQKFGQSFIETKESMKLDYISDTVLGSGKIKFNGSLQSLYKKDYETYVFYNIVDTMLVKFINDKTNLFTSFAGIGNKTRIETIKAFSPVHLTEAILCREYLKENKVMPNKERGNIENNNLMKIPGGFVKIPKPAYYEMILGCDYASLYPSIMRLLNLSPDTYLGKDLDENDIKGKYIKTPIRTYFNNEKTGTLKNLLDGKYAERKVIQKEMEEIEKKITELEKML